MRENIDTYQKVQVELETIRELFDKLMNTIKPLKENWTSFVGIIKSRSIVAPIGKLVSKIDPFSLYQYLEPDHGSVERIQ